MSGLKLFVRIFGIFQNTFADSEASGNIIKDGLVFGVTLPEIKQELILCPEDIFPSFWGSKGQQ